MMSHMGQERESCINNIKLSSQIKDRPHQDSRNNTYSRVKKQQVNRTSQQNKGFEHILGSLDNISINPIGEVNYPVESSLRRSRSLAISRETDVYRKLNADNGQKTREKQRRSQLIPRAKLIDRNSSKEPRYIARGRSVDNLDKIEQISVKSTLSITPPDYTPPSERAEKIIENSNGNELHTNEDDFDSLDSNYQNKTSINSVCKISYEELPTPNLPNYYPDSKYETDNSDYNSVTDNNSVASYNEEKENYLCYDNLEPRKFELTDHESITYDENITLSTNRPLYNSVSEHIYSKPKTIRGPTPYKTEEYFTPHSLPTYTTPPESYRSEDRDEIDENDISIEFFENDKNFDEINLNNEKIVKQAEERASEKSESPINKEPSASPIYATIEDKPNKKKDQENGVDNSVNKPEEEEISKAESCKDIIESCNDIIESCEDICESFKNTSESFEDISQFCKVISKPGKELRETDKDIEVYKDINDNCEDFTEPTCEDIKGHSKEINKTCIEVEAPPKPLEFEEYKTIVTVESDDKYSSDEEKRSKGSSKQHSHNYLKEFLESQKGSTKPLQNFIAKKFSNLSRRNSKDSSQNLVSNQFYSLPDISVGKNLRKCEKIDRKLRKCEKAALARSDSGESRFIVNIGKHFDITANASIPIDFEVKIAKIPKKNKLSKKDGYKNKTEIKFIDAVKNLKETLNGTYRNFEINGTTNKPEVIALTTKNPSTEISIRDCNKIQLHIEAEEPEMEKECNSEYQEKLGTMRSYWNKMLNGFSKSDDNKDIDSQDDCDDSKCKVIKIQTKVDEVKKKFEPKSEQEEEKIQSKVQMAKQLFEPKPVNEKHDKISPLIKETCTFFENRYGDKDNYQFESLNPCSVEIFNKSETSNENLYRNGKEQNNRRSLDIQRSEKRSRSYEHKPLGKSASDSTDPEFDHIRYRVMKSDLFQKRIFANCEKESQFDGLMQYLEDYSFQELLRDNNIVIIEPIRSKVHHEASNAAKVTRNITPFLQKKSKQNEGGKSGGGLRKHFFYHPIRVNKEVNDDELPTPDTVKQARQFFERSMKRSRSSQDFNDMKNLFAAGEIDPDKDRCSATDSNSNPSNVSDFGSQENFYDSINSELCCEQQYVSEDILEKIREHGTTVTYYGGRVIKIQNAQPSLTKAIMEEIKNNEKRGDEKCKDDIKEYNQKFKFKLLKSNSCSSRLELVGTDDLKHAKKKFLAKHKQLMKEHTTTTLEENNNKEHKINNDPSSMVITKHKINENLRKNKIEEAQRQVNGKDRKMTQWTELNNENNYSTITYNNKQPQKIDYSYHNYDAVKKVVNKKCDDMEFEPYEVA